MAWANGGYDDTNPFDVERANAEADYDAWALADLDDDADAAYDAQMDAVAAHELSLEAVQ